MSPLATLNILDVLVFKNEMLHFSRIALKLHLDSSLHSNFPKATSKNKQGKKDTSVEIRNDMY